MKEVIPQLMGHIFAWFLFVSAVVTLTREAYRNIVTMGKNTMYGEGPSAFFRCLFIAVELAIWSLIIFH